MLEEDRVVIYLKEKINLLNIKKYLKEYDMEDLGLDIDVEGQELYDIFTPLFNKSISTYENLKTVKLFAYNRHNSNFKR